MMYNRAFPIFALLISAGFIFAYIRPTYYGPIAATQQQISGFEAAITAANRFNEKDAELTTMSARIPAESVSRLNAFLPDSVDNIQLILDLNGLAARSGVVLSNFSVTDPRATAETTDTKTLVPNPDTAASPVESLTISLTATGTYQAFRVFLGAIESSLRPLDIESISVKDSKTGVYQYTLTMRIYWLR